MDKSESTSSAANLLGTVTTLVQDTQVDVTRLIYMLYLDIEQQINRADLKATDYSQHLRRADGHVGEPGNRDSR